MFQQESQVILRCTYCRVTFASDRPRKGTEMPVLYDLFITHAWRYHEDWTRAGELLDATPGLQWRNFSVPWYDPAMDPNTEVGGKFVRTWLESQITPVMGVIFLSSVYQVKSNRKWLEFEVDLARKHQKPIVGLPSFGAAELPADGVALVDGGGPWDGREIVTRLQALAVGQGSSAPA